MLISGRLMPAMFQVRDYLTSEYRMCTSTIGSNAISTALFLLRFLVTFTVI